MNGSSQSRQGPHHHPLFRKNAIVLQPSLLFSQQHKHTKTVTMFARAARSTKVLSRGFASSARVDYKVAVLGAGGKYIDEG